jgi:mannose-6-phosphate isomerase-like protein (cupin superfamily)
MSTLLAGVFGYSQLHGVIKPRLGFPRMPQRTFSQIETAGRGFLQPLAIIAIVRQHREGNATGGPAMKGFVADIEELTENNSDFRRVVYTGKNLQLVLMSIEPGGEIGEEVHDDGDQFVRVEEGKAEVWIDGQKTSVESDDAIVVPAGARHNVVNKGGKTLKLYTLYAPPEHRDGTVHASKADADALEEHFDGKTTE